jgi:hypothetical protein
VAACLFNIDHLGENLFRNPNSFPRRFKQHGKHLTVMGWALATLELKLILKTLGEPGRLVKHARYYWLHLAESHLARRLFGAMVRRIGLLSMPAKTTWPICGWRRQASRAWIWARTWCASK